MNRQVRRLLLARLLAVAAVLGLASSALIGRLMYLQVLMGPVYGQAALNEQNSKLQLPPQRGQITDREGRILALETTGDALYAMPRAIRDPQALSAALAGVLGVDQAALYRQLTSPRPFVWISYHVTAAQAQKISKLGTYDGLGLQSASWRIYPQGNLAGAVVGFVGVDQKGLAGVEETYNRQLTGKPGSEIIKVDALGNPLPQYAKRYVPAVPGDGLQTTLDLAIQAFAQQDLAQAVKQHHAKGGRIVVLNPSTGGIEAIAQYPEPNPADWQSYPMSQWADEPVEYAFEPGSTIKPVTAAAALSTGVATPSWTIDDNGYIVIDGVRIYDWVKTGFGRLTFDGIMQESSDVGFADLAIKMGAQKLYSFYHAFHLDRRTGVDLPGESGGLLPPENKATNLDLGEMGFGQTLAVTPLQLAAAVSSIADGGVWHTPHIGMGLTLPNGKVQPLRFASQRVVSPTVAQEVQTAMLKVISNGTGALAKVPGYRIAGKTGTANVVGNSGRFQSGDFLSSFVGFGPVPDPRALILVQIDDPQGQFYGGDVAAPVFSTLMLQVLDYLHVPPSGVTIAPTKVAVPDLTGLTFADAALRAEAAGLALVSGGQGTRVVGQSPAPTSSVLPGASVHVTLGGQKAPPGVPDVLGMTVQQAYSTLDNNGLKLRVSGAGIAVRQSPAPGSPASKSEMVTVYFSAPP